MALAHGGRRLQQAQLTGALRHTKGNQPRGHRPRGHQDHVMAALAQPGDKTGDNIDTVEIKTAVGAGQRRRADLEHDARPIGQPHRPEARRPHASSPSSR